jgi:hypothetical protein
MDSVFQGQKLFSARLAIGLVQGLALYALYSAYDDKVWPATQGLLFAPLLLCWLFIPTLLISALGELPWRKALVWAAIALVVTAGLAVFDNWSAWPQEWAYTKGAMQPHIVPSIKLFFFWGAGLFIAHTLVLGGYTDRRAIASYPTHFDTAWKLALQLAMAVLFVGAFWLLLWLGAGLFNLIKLTFLARLISHAWFGIPVSTLAAAGALHLTDIRPSLVRGARTLLLTLLSWLLPLIVLIVGGFIVSLPFTGLQALWATGHASALLLTAAAALVILINATHQDGEPDRWPPRLLRQAGTLAALLALPLALIAAYALYLRVGQYGWSVDRVFLVGSVITALGYASGYAAAALRPGAWLNSIKVWNFGMSLVVLALIIVLFADQIARLNSGKISAEKFDYRFLRWEGGRYGMQALQQMARSKTGNASKMAQAALQQHDRYDSTTLAKEQLMDRLTVYPSGTKLPQSFVRMDWSLNNQQALIQSNCAAQASCDAILTDLDGDGRPEILIVNIKFSASQVFREDGHGMWALAGTINLPRQCPRVLDALRQGHFQTQPPPLRMNDIALEGVRLHVYETELGMVTPPCQPE